MNKEDLDGIYGFNARQEQYWRQQEQEDRFGLIKGALNALGLVAVIYLFGFFLLKVIPWIIINTPYGG